MEQIDPVEKKICLACEKEKKITSYSRTRNGNRPNVCNSCRSLGRTIPNELKSSRARKSTTLRLGNPKMIDYEKCYKFLESAGYSLKEEDIHEQFCKKYGLTPNSPKKTFLNYYSPKDLGLI